MSRTYYLRNSRETAVNSSPGQMKSCCSSPLRNHGSLSYTIILKQLQTIRQPIPDHIVISGYSLEEESERFTSLSKGILHRVLSMTEGESHALL
eukprot:1982689-Amphidinium_carterae.1